MALISLQNLDELLSEPVSSVMEREHTALDFLLHQHQNQMVLFGAGNLGRRALRCLRGIGIEPLALSDNNPLLWGTQIEGVPVLEPRVAAAQFGQAAVFIVMIWNAKHRFVETRRQLESLGCRSVSAGAPIQWRFAQEFLPAFCQDLPHKVYENAGAVEAAAGVWADERSRCEYVNQIRWRALGDYDCLSAPEQPETYFPQDIIEISTEEVLVDCGAYDGDTILDFLALSEARFRSILAIEADGKTFARLQAAIDELPSAVRDRITALHCAVGARRELLRFEDTGGVNSCFSDQGESVVSCFPLTDILSDVRATYLKMDIEGAEFDALTGAREMIEREWPVLAICVYHRQDDLWRLPLFIKEMVPQYNMYLRTYEAEGSQTVAYAVPPGRKIQH